MLSTAGLEVSFRAEAVSIACYLVNRNCTTALDHEIPELWSKSNKPVDYSFLHIFGCDAYVQIH